MNPPPGSHPTPTTNSNRFVSRLTPIATDNSSDYTAQFSNYLFFFFIYSKIENLISQSPRSGVILLHHIFIWFQSNFVFSFHFLSRNLIMTRNDCRIPSLSLSLSLSIAHVSVYVLTFVTNTLPLKDLKPNYNFTKLNDEIINVINYKIKWLI